MRYSPASRIAIRQLRQRRESWVADLLREEGGSPRQCNVEIDVSLVTFNSERWLREFFASLERQDFPLGKVNLWLVDHGSADGTVALLRSYLKEQGERYRSCRFIHQENRGFGAGHNVCVREGKSPFILVTNVDLAFESNAIVTAVTTAFHDPSDVVSWELRQKPFEHPKYYDPVTLETNWSSHACVLLRREAMEACGGYESRIFMYGEDVELSYRLRRAGCTLRYCPRAVVWHYSYEEAGQVKPLQYSGAALANALIRLRYGSARDIAEVVPMQLGRLLKSEIIEGARRAQWSNLAKLLRAAPAFIGTRKPRGGQVKFPFRGWDFDLCREGAFVEGKDLAPPLPLVSIITRTQEKRGPLLVQAMLSVLNQSWPNVELIVVEAGGDTLRKLVEHVSAGRQDCVRYVSLMETCRSFAGNAGLAEARGELMMFLDDDSLLFADHVETLATALTESRDEDAAYSLAWMVRTRFPSGDFSIWDEDEYLTVPAHRTWFAGKGADDRSLIPIQSVLFRHTLFERHGGLVSNVKLPESTELWQRFGGTGSFAFVPKTTSIFRTPWH